MGALAGLVCRSGWLKGDRGVAALFLAADHQPRITCAPIFIEIYEDMAARVHDHVAIMQKWHRVLCHSSAGLTVHDRDYYVTGSQPTAKIQAECLSNAQLSSEGPAGTYVVRSANNLPDPGAASLDSETLPAPSWEARVSPILPKVPA